MTDKEERIVVSEWRPKEKTDNKINLLRLQDDLDRKSISRAEAVERMAKALWDMDQKRISLLYKDFAKTSWGALDLPRPDFKICLQKAEAALDALLGGTYD